MNMLFKRNDTNMQIPMKSFSDLKGLLFHIPFQQRGYKWRSSNVKELLSDLKEFMEQDKRLYCLQPLAVVNMGNERYSVLDGQQRLTTLFLLYVYLFRDIPYQFEFQRDDDSDEEGTVNRWDFLMNIDSLADSGESESNIDFFFIANAYSTIQEWFSADENLKERFRELIEATKDSKSVQVIWYEVDKEKEYETFRNLNSGKISLTNTELIKALLLNRVSGLPCKEREEAAAQFETIEREMQNDRFWYMFNSEEVRKGQTRMDFLFNIVTDCSQDDYNTDNRCSFRKFAEVGKENGLSKKWEEVRHTFLRLKDFYQDIYIYHYIGFLTYYNGDNSIENLKKWLKLNREVSHSRFVEALRSEIRKIMNRNGHQNVDDYSYDSSTKVLRLLFILHNIETILQRYESLKSNKVLRLQHEFEQFPFELLHKQSWDIEHIASQTESDFRNEQDRLDWLGSIKADMGEEYPEKDVKELEKKYMAQHKKEDFDALYRKIMEIYDSKNRDSIKDEDEDGKNKNQIGNLVLLDSHTNRSFHNSLFPRKRRIVIIADGLKSGDDAEEGITQLFIPVCTRQCFTKAYSKGSDISLNIWSQHDADAYTKDIKEKLCDSKDGSRKRYFDYPGDNLTEENSSTAN